MKYFSNRDKQIVSKLADQNHISIINKNPKFDTNVYYSTVWKRFVIVLNNDELIFGNRYKTINDVYKWILKNIDDSGEDFNVKFNYNPSFSQVKRGRLYYILDPVNWRDESMKELLLLLLI